MNISDCQKGCCQIKIKPYVDSNKCIRKQRNKAGIFIYDPLTDKVLLVQSCGNLWGPPKGSIEFGESPEECAIREVEEETGLIIDISQLSIKTTIRKQAVYYYLEMNECAVEVQDCISSNDANGICWIKLNCLENLINKGDIYLSYHCRTLFYRFLRHIFAKYMNRKS